MNSAQKSGYRIKQLLDPADLPLHIRQKLNAGLSFDAAFVAPFVMDDLIKEGRCDLRSRPLEHIGDAIEHTASST